MSSQQFMVQSSRNFSSSKFNARAGNNCFINSSNCGQIGAPAASCPALEFSAAFTDNGKMARTTQQLEARLDRVEKELAALKAALAGQQRQPWYREIVGVFAGDEAFVEIARLGRQIRQGKIKG
jgi:hypothetical protein